MSASSGMSSQGLSLPSGGGALRGLGESFVADLHTGCGTFKVPLALPGGRNGFGAQLQLSYSTGYGNGPFGLGWTCGISRIARSTANGVPRYGDDDRFMLDRAHRLRPVDVNRNRTRFRTTPESDFS